MYQQQALDSTSHDEQAFESRYEQGFDSRYEQAFDSTAMCAACGGSSSIRAVEDWERIAFCTECLDRAGPPEWPYDDLGGNE